MPGRVEEKVGVVGSAEISFVYLKCTMIFGRWFVEREKSFCFRGTDEKRGH